MGIKQFGKKVIDADDHFYKKFLGAMSNGSIRILYSKNKKNLETDEEYEIKYNIKVRENIDLQDIHFKIKFILMKQDWKIRYEEKIGEDSYKSFSMSRIKFYSKWYKTVEKKTDNIYNIEYDDFKYPEDLGDENKTLKFSIAQGGDWQLLPIVIPSNNEYWVSFSGLRVSVAKPDDMLSKLSPFAIPLFIGVLIITTTIKIKTRKLWLIGR
ncbi:MAG: hypothetical protein ACOCZJ_03890 [Thermoplasmatota archaeon]